MSDIEHAVIGGLMLLGDMTSPQAVKVLSMLKPQSFSDVNAQIAFEAINRLESRGASVDLLSVDVEAQNDKRCNAGYLSFLGDIAGNTPSAANIVNFAFGVRDKAIQRFANTKLQQIIALVNDSDEGDINKRLGLAGSMLAEIQEQSMYGRDKGLRHVKEIAKEWMLEVDERTKNENPSGFTTGIKALDRMLYPKQIPKGSLVVVGARPKMGKTTFMSFIVDHFSTHRKEPVALFSLEMPDKQIFERMVVSKSNINSDLLYIKNKADEGNGWNAVSEAVRDYNNSRLYIDDTAGVSLGHIQRESRKLARKGEVGIIAADYLTLMKAEKADRNDLAYGKITKGLKNLAKELNCVVLLLTQMNRTADGARPKPSQSRDTGQIEQDCDLWIGLHREKALGMAEHDYTEIIVALNRHGGTGTVYMEMKEGCLRECEQTQARAMCEIPQEKSRGFKSNA